jgi:dTDP-4-amino-4,6-dideoxygalactose transaminase
MEHVPFNLPYVTGEECDRIREAVANRQLSGNGPFTAICQAWLQYRVGCARAFLAQSCTAALEMAALLAEVGPGDEVVMPSFTFVSTANAFVGRGATPVFVDIRPDTLNLDERQIEQAITSHTKAIVPVHYGGVACDMDAILEIAARHGAMVIEDAAHGLLASYNSRPLGSLGHLSALSFHETKNVSSGEGGALLVNDNRLTARAEVVWQKGTDRLQFARGEVQKYTWVDVGSSFLPSEITAAFLSAQMDGADEIGESRMAVWARYHDAFEDLEAERRVRRPVVPHECQHNAHLYYLLLPTRPARDAAIDRLNARGINAVFHYVPLHSSPAGRRYGRMAAALPVTDEVSGCLMRLPLWAKMPDEAVARVIAVTRDVLGTGN